MGRRSSTAEDAPSPLVFADTEIGHELPELSVEVSRLSLFLFSVAYWAPHRIHYDPEFARSEGYDDVLVTANLVSAYNARLVEAWTGGDDCLVSLEERNIAPIVAGQRLRLTGVVEGREPTAHGGRVRCALSTFRADGLLAVTGTAVVELP